MEVKTYTIDEIKNIVTPIAEKYQIAQVYLFGSFARGDFDEQSDIDIRIEKGNLKGMFALCGFYTEVSDALGRKVDVLTTGSLSDEFLESIKRDEVMLYAGQWKYRYLNAYQRLLRRNQSYNGYVWKGL